MKKDAPSAHRNREPLLEVLRQVLPPTGRILEIASGSGQHALWFAGACPGWDWQPTDRDPEALASVAAWRDEEGPANLRTPLYLDVTEPWPVESADAVVAINVVHASPWEAGLALLAGAARVLSPGGPLVLYGAWRENGVAEPSNETFDLWLKERDPRWGIKDVGQVIAAAEERGLGFVRQVQMPANNRVVLFARR